MANPTQESEYSDFNQTVRPRNFPVRPYSYYGNGQYPQYRGMTSGINMMGSNAIPQGWENMLSSLKDIQQTEYEDETARQNKFREAASVSIKDAKGRWRDEAVTKRDDFLNFMGKKAAENQGRFTYQEEKEIMEKKEGIEAFAGMSKEVEDWYTQSLQTAMSIKDKTAQRKTFENISNIMSSETSLEDVYAQTQDPKWLVSADSLYTTNQVMAAIPSGYTPSGKPDPTKIAGGVQGMMDDQDDIIEWHKDKFYANNPNATPDDYKKYATEQKQFWMNNQPANKFTYFPPYRRDPNAKTDKRPEIKANSKNQFLFGDVPVDMNSYRGPGDVNYKDAAIETVEQTPDGDWVAVITHTIPNTSVKEYEVFMEKTLGKERFDKWVKYGLITIQKNSKDPTASARVAVPYEDFKEMIGRNVILKDMDKLMSAEKGNFDPTVDPN